MGFEGASLLGDGFAVVFSAMGRVSVLEGPPAFIRIAVLAMSEKEDCRRDDKP